MFRQPGEQGKLVNRRVDVPLPVQLVVQYLSPGPATKSMLNPLVWMVTVLFV